MTAHNDESETDGRFSIDHVAVSVSDLSRSIDFYSRNFGFVCERVIELPRGGGRVAVLRGPGFAIEMFEFPDVRPLPDYRKMPDSDLKTMGVKHFALKARDIMGASDFLKRNGVEFISEVTVGARGARRFFVKDPDGVGIEVTEESPVPERKPSAMS
jgi:catechol 2,3-dioxygenase-like lactoylglutathione lyase family enzyme